MKYLILLLFIISSFCSFGQDDDESKYIWYKYTYGTRIDRGWFNKVLRTPTDTIYTKYGLAIKGTTLYYGDGTMWREAGSGGGSGTVTSVDAGWGTSFPSITTTGDVVVDSLQVASWYRLYKMRDSLAGIWNKQRLGVSGEDVTISTARLVNVQNTRSIFLYADNNGTGDGYWGMTGTDTRTLDFSSSTGRNSGGKAWEFTRDVTAGGGLDYNFVTNAGNGFSRRFQINSGYIGFDYGDDSLSVYGDMTLSSDHYRLSHTKRFSFNINSGGSVGNPYLDINTSTNVNTFGNSSTQSYVQGRVDSLTLALRTSSSKLLITNLSNTVDTTFKALVRNGSTNETKAFNSWAELGETMGWGSGGTPTLQQVVDQGNTLNDQSISMGGTGGPGYIQWDNDADATSVAQFNDGNTDISFQNDATLNGIRLSFSGLTAFRIYQFPDVAGTFALRDVANSWADGVKQTFNPDGTNSGLNVGSHTADPSSPANGDLFYNSTSNALRARINGAWVSLGAGGGSPGGSDGQLQYRVNSTTFGGITNATSDGTNLTVTTPRILTGIRDQYGNEIFDFTDTESTVNFLTFANAITTENPKWTATGTDTDIGIDWLSKGAGTFRFLGNATQAAEIRLYEDTDNGTNYTAFKVGVQSANLTYTLPTAYPAVSGYVLSSTDAGVMSWVAQGSGTVSFGTDNQIPSTNSGGTDFDYSANFTFDGNLFKVIANSLGVTQDDTKGSVLINTTAAADGAQQISPALRWSGQGWKTDATAASQEVEFRAFVLPIQGASNPTAEWKLQSSINGGAYTDIIRAFSHNEIQIGDGTLATTGDYKLNVAASTGKNALALNAPAGQYDLVLGNNGFSSMLLFYNATGRHSIEGYNQSLGLGAGGHLKLWSSANEIYFGTSDNPATANYARFSNAGGLSIGSGVVGTDAGAGNILISGFLTSAEIAAPSTPASGFGAVYFKTDGKIYAKNDGGTEYDLTATGGGGALDDLSDVTITSAATGEILRYNGSAWVNAATTNITTLGTITTGTWNASVLAGQYGGTGVANTGKTLTLSGNTVIGSSTHTVTLNTSGNTSTTLPVNGTIPSYKENAITSNATWSPTGDARDNYYDITAQAAAVTTISNPSGTAANHNTLLIRVKDNGTARALTWSGTEWRAGTNLALPTTTTLGKTMYIKFIYNSTDTKWDLISVIDGLAFEWIYILLVLLIAMIATKAETKIIQMKKFRRAA